MWVIVIVLVIVLIIIIILLIRRRQIIRIIIEVYELLRRGVQGLRGGLKAFDSGLGDIQGQAGTRRRGGWRCACWVRRQDVLCGAEHVMDFHPPTHPPTRPLAPSPSPTYRRAWLIPGCSEISAPGFAHMFFSARSTHDARCFGLGFYMIPS